MLRYARVRLIVSALMIDLINRVIIYIDIQKKKKKNIYALKSMERGSLAVSHILAEFRR